MTTPFLALSIADYHAKAPLLEEMPVKVARRYQEALKYQALVGTLLAAFERYPAIQQIRFEPDGSRDVAISNHEILAQGPGVEDIPLQDCGIGPEMALTELYEFNDYFFEDDDVRVNLAYACFWRDDVVDQLATVLRYDHAQWDVSWEAFIDLVYAHLGRPEARAQQAQRWAEVSPDPTVGEAFRRIPGVAGFEQALAAAPDHLYQARILAPDLDGTEVPWSILSRGLMYLLGKEDIRSHSALSSVIWDIRDKAGKGQSSAFTKLAGPHHDRNSWAPASLDPLALIWIATGRCAFCEHQRIKSTSDALLAWAGCSAAEADYRAIDQCLVLATEGGTSPLFNNHTYRHCRTVLGRIWTTWLDRNTVPEERMKGQSFELMSNALLYFGGKVDNTPPWPGGYSFMQKLTMPALLDMIPPSPALRMGLASLVQEHNKQQIAEAETYLLGLIDKGGHLDLDDPFLDERLSGKGVTERLRQRLRETLV